MKLHDVAVTPDSLRLIAVGLLLESPTGLQPSKSRAEKRLIGEFRLILLRDVELNDVEVYNTETKLVEK